MPRVPSYDNFQTSVTGQPNAQFNTPSGPAPGAIAADQAAQLGQSLTRSGDAVGKIALEVADQANRDVVNAQSVELSKLRTNLTIEAMSLKGRAALERPDGKSLQDEYQEKFKAATDKMTDGLKNPAQRQMFNQQVLSSQEHMLSSLGGHVIQQSKQFRADGQAARVEEYQRVAGLLYADKAELANSKAGIESVLAEVIADNGWDSGKDKALIADTRAKLLSPMHTGVIKGYITGGKPEDAQAYFSEHSAEMTLQSKVTMQDAVQHAVTAGQAQAEGARLATKYGYTQTTEAQKEIDAMDKPPSEKVAIRAELEHRHAVMQSDSDKNNAILIGKLDEAIQRGMSISDVQKMPEFMQVRDKGSVLKMARDKAYTDLLRANASDARALSALQRHETQLHIDGAAKAFNYMDPTVLANTPREKIANMLPELGRQWTETLLNRKDSIEKKGPQDAKVDHDDMMSVMQEMKLKPFEKSKTEEGKATLAITQSRIERRLTEMQNNGARLSREDKNSIIREEVAKTATIEKPWYVGGDETKPAIELTQSDLAKVAIPANEKTEQKMPNGTVRKSIQDEMSELYKLSGGKASEFEPTQENMARFYLQYRKGAATTKYIPRAANAK